MTTRGRAQADLDGPETPIAFGSLTAADVATDSNMPQAGNNAPRPSDRPELGNAARNQDETDIEALVNRFDALLALDANLSTILAATDTLSPTYIITKLDLLVKEVLRLAISVPDAYYAANGIRLKKFIDAVAIAQLNLDVDSESDVDRFYTACKVLEPKLGTLANLVAARHPSPRYQDDARALSRCVEKAAEFSFRLLERWKYQRKEAHDTRREAQDATRSEEEAKKRAEGAVRHMEWKDVSSVSEQFTTIRAMNLAKLAEEHAVRFLIDLTKVHLPGDSDADLKSFVRHVKTPDFQAPRTFDAFILLLKSFESPEKAIARARKVFELASERHDFAGANDVLTLRDRVSEIDEQLSLTHQTSRHGFDLGSLQRHLPTQIYMNVTDVHVLLRTIFTAWGLDKTSAEFRAELGQLAREFCAVNAMPMVMDHSYVAGSLRLIFEESGIRAKIEGVAAAIRAERTARQAIGSTASPILAISSMEDAAAADTDPIMAIDYDSDSAFMDVEHLAVALAEIACDCCGTRGHRVSECERAKPTIEAIITALRSQSMVSKPPISYDRLLNAVRVVLRLPFPNHRRTRFRSSSDGNR